MLTSNISPFSAKMRKTLPLALNPAEADFKATPTQVCRQRQHCEKTPAHSQHSRIVRGCLI